MILFATLSGPTSDTHEERIKRLKTTILLFKNEWLRFNSKRILVIEPDVSYTCSVSEVLLL